jgi:hypothetical protein
MQQRPGKEAPREERQKTIVVEERPPKISNIVEKLEGTQNCRVRPTGVLDTIEIKNQAHTRPRMKQEKFARTQIPLSPEARRKVPHQGERELMSKHKENLCLRHHTNQEK